jgi:hypothetical protein
LQNPKTQATGEHELVFKVNDVPLSSGDIVYSGLYPLSLNNGVRLKIDVFNPLSVPYSVESSLAIIAPTFIKYTGYDTNVEAVKTVEGNYLHTIGSLKSIFPKGYISFKLVMDFRNRNTILVLRKGVYVH